MTKEKLEEYEDKIVMQEKSKLQKEAENYLNQNCKRWELDNLSVDDIAIENYLVSAEPREKRIADLEKKVNENDICIEDLELANIDLQKQLAQAKEHIITLISCLIDWVQEGDKDYCLIADAEQFLKDLEK